VRARLGDAKFFRESDLHQTKQENGFDDWINGLDNVTFHAKLGSQGERVKRIIELAGELSVPIAKAYGLGAEETPDTNVSPSRSCSTATSVSALKAQAKQAAKLAKADLQSAMVYEFPEMQGKMGRRYAQIAGEPASVALAIEEHYKPLGPTDDVPSDPVSVAVALADKLDTLVGFWAIDEKPTGSKDPFALRRAALGVIRLLVENGVRLNLESFVIISYTLLIHNAWHKGHLWAEIDGNLTDFPNVVPDGNDEEGNYVHTSPPVIDDNLAYGIKPLSFTEFDKLEDGINIIEQVSISGLECLLWVKEDLLFFFHDRLKVFLKDKGIRHDVIDAVLSSPHPEPVEGQGDGNDGSPTLRQAQGEGVVDGGRSEGTNTNDGVESNAPPPSIPPHKEEGSSSNDDLLLIVQKATALQKLVDSDDGTNLIQGYKRAANILAAEEKKKTQIASSVSADLFEVDEERSLFETLEDVEGLAASAIEAENFEVAMERLATLRAPIDAFFEKVHVNSDDENVRANRLALLARIRAATATVADFSKISG